MARRQHIRSSARSACWPCFVLLALASAACAGPDPLVGDAGSSDYTLLDDTLACLPDNDGVIESSELSFVAGLAASYRVNPPGTEVEVQTAGQLVGGKTEWDFSSLQGQVVKVKVEPVVGSWFADHFPAGEIAMGVTATAADLQVLRVEPTQVLLLGVVSREPDRTLIVYEPPIVAMRFPLRRGLSFSSTATLKEGSRLNGLPIATRDTYEIAVESEGVVRLPNLKLHRTLRISTRVTSKAVGGVVATTRQLQWFSECYGEVARVVSKPNEPDPTFTKASEFRRLSF